MFRRARSWAANNRLRTITVAVPDPVATDSYSVVERAWARGMNGRSGAIIIGEKSSPGWAFKGYLASESVPRPPVMAASRNRIGSPNVALPGTNGAIDVVSGGSVADSLAAIPVSAR